MSDRSSIVEARQTLLLRALRSEFLHAPVGEFEARWNAIDPATPAPAVRPVRHLTCECESCLRDYEGSERPVLE